MKMEHEREISNINEGALNRNANTLNINMKIDNTNAKQRIYNCKK